jgi:nucleoside-diphosphate-sugar epimerase
MAEDLRENQPDDEQARDGRALADKRRVLVTGASGFLGGHVARRVRAAGVDVVAPSRSDGFDLLRDELPLDGVDHLFHIAGRTGVVAAWEEPGDFFALNAGGTVRVLEQCRRARVPVTYVSAYLYGQPRELPIAEDHPVVPDNPYAFSKHAAEEACRFYARYLDVPVTIVRPFNIYGPGQPASFLVPTVVAQVLDEACQTIEVMDLAPRRDYVFVADVVDALFASLAAPAGSLFNVGSGESHSVGELVDLACRVAGVSKTRRAIAPAARRGEIDDVVADISAIRRAIGWAPRVSLEQGLRRMMAAGGP